MIFSWFFEAELLHILTKTDLFLFQALIFDLDIFENKKISLPLLTDIYLFSILPKQSPCIHRLKFIGSFLKQYIFNVYHDILNISTDQEILITFKIELKTYMLLPAH